MFAIPFLPPAIVRGYFCWTPEEVQLAKDADTPAPKEGSGQAPVHSPARPVVDPSQVNAVTSASSSKAGHHGYTRGESAQIAEARLRPPGSGYSQTV